MYLKRLEIYGFKSFGAKSVLDFEDKKIAAIVGPNGSGKSNVADAIRWVLGEQSTNILRSKKGEDVIFAGSQKKSRSSYCEVCLTLSSKDVIEIEIDNKKFDLKEIEISRKIFRSGENEYLINRKKVRLFDLQHLLATLGFGQSSYTVIGQGIVDRLLFFNAAERRVLFDEAAGVKQYKIKRGQAIKKLENTEENLVRLKDIEKELEPQVASLKRLVKKAEGREKIEEELEVTQNEYYGSFLYELDKDIKAYDEDILVLRKEINAKKGEIETLRNKNQDSKIEKIREETDTKKKELEALLRERDGLIGDASFLEGQAKEQENYFINLKNNRQNLLAEEKKINCELAELKIKKKELESKVLGVTKALHYHEKERSKIQQTIDAGPKQQLDQDRLNILENKKKEIENELFRISEKEKLSREQKEEKSKEKRALGAALSQIVRELSEKDQKRLDLVQKNKRITNEIELIKAKIESALVSIPRMEKELSGLSKAVDQTKLTDLSNSINTIRAEYLKIDTSLKENKPLSQIKSIIKNFGEKLANTLADTEKITSMINPENKARIEKNLNDARNKIQEHQSVLNEKYLILHETNQKVAILEHQIQQLKSAKKEKSLRGESILVEETENFLPTIKKLEEEKHKLQNEIDKLNAEARSKEERLKNLEATKRKKQTEIASNIYEQKVTLAKLESELEHNDRSTQILENELKEVSKLVSRSQEKDYDRTLDEKSADLKRKLSEVNNKAAILKEEIEGENRNVTELESLLITREREINKNEREISELTSRMNERELNRAKAETRQESMLLEIRTNEIMVKPLNKIITQEEKDILRARIENLRRKKELIVGVDPETLKEYEESENRLSGMVDQIADLESAKDNLQSLISELDRKIQKQFGQTFKAISDKFQNYFELLFNGGKADLVLGEDNEGELGIEIIANPPGKRIQNLAMLSGGERTMTSLALVFAILSINPSPFCVLDEVDAALDESNTLRFVKILESLDKKTQFIVITHNRETMKIADLLYGLSMNDEHISKLFSIRLAEAIRSTDSA